MKIQSTTKQLVITNCQRTIELLCNMSDKSFYYKDKAELIKKMHELRRDTKNLEKQLKQY